MFAWGAQSIVAGLGLGSGLSALDLTALRFVFGGAVLAPWFIRHGIRDACGIGWGRAFVITALAGPTMSLLFIGGIAFAPASHASLVLAGMVPVLTALMAVVFLHDQADRPSWPGIACVVAGVALVNHDAFRMGMPEAWKGHLMFLTAAVSWSLFTILCRRWRLDPWASTVVVSVLTMIPALLYLPVAFPRFAAAPGTALWQGFYHGIVVSVGAMIGYMMAIQKLGARGSMFTALVPVIALVLAIPILGERPGLPGIAGAALVVSGLIASILRGRAARDG